MKVDKHERMNGISKYSDLNLNFIDGKWREGTSEEVIESINPFTDETVASVKAASLEDLDEAYESAKKHQKEWAETSPFARAGIIRKAIQVIEEKKDDLVDILVDEAGSTLAKAELEVDIVVAVMHLAAEFPFQMETIVNQSMIPGKKNYVARKPLGVVGVIGPFNFPFNLSMRSVAPALAAGNAVVLKPGHQTPISGGNNAMVVLDDADIDRAVNGAIYGRFMHSGQICMATNRIIVDEAVFDDFAEKFVEKTRELKHGDPRQEGTLIGPLIDSGEVERLLEEVDKAKSEGAEVLLEGKREGNVLTPFILKGTNDMTTAQNEMFGPVVTLIPAKDEAHALELANDTEAGLSGAVSSSDEKRAYAFAEKMETGMVHINDQSVNDEPYIAFGGEKASGLGRFGREHSLDEFTTWKWISVQEEQRRYPFE